MKLTLVSIERDYVRAAAEGRITAADVAGREGAVPMQALLGQTWSSNNVLLDMSRVSYIDSSGIGWLITCHKEFQKQGGRLVLHSVPSTVMQILELLNIGKVLSLAEDEAAAKQLVTEDRNA